VGAGVIVAEAVDVKARFGETVWEAVGVRLGEGKGVDKGDKPGLHPLIENTIQINKTVLKRRTGGCTRKCMAWIINQPQGGSGL
jgi:hypothetical protein